MQFFHASLWNAKNGSFPFFVTGGSWKKSPVTTSCEKVSVSQHYAYERAIYLDPAEWSVALLAQLDGQLRERVKELAVDHRHLVDDQHLCVLPPLMSRLASLDVAN